MSVKINAVDTIAEEDVYRRGGEYTTYSQLWIRPENRECGVCQVSGAPGVGTPEEEWHNRVLTYNIGGGKEFRRETVEAPNEDDLEEFLGSKKGQKLLDRICDGHDINWDGNNMVGELNDDAESALQALLRAIEALPRTEWTSWTVEDWLYEYRRTSIKADMTDQQIERIAKEAEDLATSEHVYLMGDVEDYFIEYRNELRDEE